MRQKAYLLLADGSVFEGMSFGAVGKSMGEVVFNTSMTGYLETITDPSYFGQIVVQTFPLIGNYGLISPDFESSKPQIKGYIVREWCQLPSNFRSEGDIDTFLKQKNIIGLYDIDTRSLTKIIRRTGVMNGMITDSLDDKEKMLEQIKAFRIEQAVESVSCDAPHTGIAGGKTRITLMDFGTKYNIARELEKRGCEVTVVPADTTAEAIIAAKPDGIMLSNGPGDPEENTAIIAEIAKLCDSGIPIFGICLGHQLLGLAMGGKTQKLKYGHRGANQPVRNLETGRVYITSQNHGYAVMSETLPPNVGTLLYENANDSTCEGIRYTGRPVFSVQFHPEACGGPMDTGFLFDEFIAMIQNGGVR